MAIAVFGAGGQLGQALVAAGGTAVRAYTHGEADIADAEAVGRLIGGARVVVNAAAYNAVDAAESDIVGAWRGNVAGPATLAQACAASGAALIHVSSDYVFDGARRRPFRENDAPNPLGAYGQSKWEGEEAVRETLERHFIVRTAWVFSATGRNFVKTMWQAGFARDEVRVVDDQVGSPTFAGDLAGALLQLAQAAMAAEPPSWGTYHYAGQPALSWCAFARAIYEHHPRPPKVVSITTADWPTAAQRPTYSALDCAKMKRTFGIKAPDWRDGLAEVVRHLPQQGANA